MAGIARNRSVSNSTTLTITNRYRRAFSLKLQSLNLRANNVIGALSRKQLSSVKIKRNQGLRIKALR